MTNPVTSVPGGGEGEDRCPWCRVRAGDFPWLIDGHQPGCPTLPLSPCPSKATTERTTDR